MTFWRFIRFDQLSRTQKIIIAGIVLLIAALAIGLGLRKENFADALNGIDPTHRTVDGRFYNPLYVSPDYNMMGSFYYTAPMGDTQAQAAGDSGQGTSGGFLPLQGIGAGVMMKNSSNQNLSLSSPDPGTIGGYPNYTEQQFSSSWIGFNNFGTPFDTKKGPEISDQDYSNSYLINGANERVTNSGQKADQLQCQSWVPRVEKGSDGYCLQGSDATVECTTENGNDNLSTCMQQGSVRFIENKMLPQWMKV